MSSIGVICNVIPAALGDIMREALKNKKGITVIGKYMAVDWDGWNDRPTYLLEKVQVFNKQGDLIDKIDHLWFLCDEELYALEDSAIIKFVGDSYKYSKAGHIVDYSVRPTSNVLIMKWLGFKVKVGKWFKKKSKKKR
jgi:hypothetical protein